MKNLLFTLSILLAGIGCFGQSIEIDAGADAVFCDNELFGHAGDTLRLGGSPTVYNADSVPYTISWSMINDYSERFEYGASHVLDDTTASNPIFDARSLDSCLLLLTVQTDSSIFYDSVLVRVSVPLITLVDMIQISVYRGDTAALYPFMGSSVGTKYAIWTPNSFINNDSAVNPLVWPPSDRTYRCTMIIDSLDCVYQHRGTWDIRVLPPQSVSEINGNRSQVKVMQDIGRYSIQNPQKLELHILRISLLGQVLNERVEKQETVMISQHQDGSTILIFDKLNAQLLWRMIDT